MHQQKNSSKSTIPSFPEFAPLELGHRAQIERLTANYEPYADFTFVNLFTWSINDSTEVSNLRGNLVVRLPDYMTDETIYSFIGLTEIDESLEQLFSLSPTLNLVPEVVVNGLRNPARYIITEDRDGHDYIYDVERLVSFSGGELKKKRNKLHRFATAFEGRIQTTTTNTVDARTSRELREVFDVWAKENEKTQAQFRAESVAIDRLLTNLSSLSVMITIVRIDGQVCAFSVNEVLQNGLAICHFEKALKVHEGAYAYIINEVAKELLAFGCRRVNWEQDLGLPGLRQAKSSYQPSGFLRKYSVSVR